MPATERTPLVRDLEAAKGAYAIRDVDATRKAHAGDGSSAQVEEAHSKHGEYLKPCVFGGLDGILTSFAIVAGSAGGLLSWEVVLILGFSNIFADALSMGVGEYLSAKAEREYVLKERSREAWELDVNPEGEIEEMMELYVAKGISREDAHTLLTTMAKYKEFFVDVMMVEELGLQSPDPEESLLGSALCMFGAFASFGSLPLLGYVVFPAIFGITDGGTLFMVACIVTAVSLFALGAAKGSISGRSWVLSGAETLILGGACASIAYTIGWMINEAFVRKATEALQ